MMEKRREKGEDKSWSQYTDMNMAFRVQVPMKISKLQGLQQ